MTHVCSALVWLLACLTVLAARPAHARQCALVSNQGRDTIARVDLERNLPTSNILLVGVSCEVGPPPSLVGIASFAPTDDGRLFIKTQSCAVLPYDIASGESTGFFSISQQRWDGGVAVRGDGDAFFTPASEQSIVAYTGWDRKEIQVGNSPSAVALSPDENTVYVANSGVSADGQPDSISVVDTATLSVRTTIPVLDAPVSLAVSPDGERLYVGHQVPGIVSVVDTIAGTVITSYEIADVLQQLVLAHDGTTLYVVRLRSNNTFGAVAVNAASGDIVAESDIGAYYLAPGSDGSLYALADEEVVRLDPQTLAVDQRIPLGDCGCGGFFEQCVGPCYRQQLVVTDVPNGCGSVCGGDCDGDGTVSINEIVTGVAIALDVLSLNQCAACDEDGNGAVTVDDLVRAVSHALDGCPK
jgi:YVTN family beta-propeller protein